MSYYNRGSRPLVHSRDSSSGRSTFQDSSSGRSTFQDSRRSGWPRNRGELDQATGEELIKDGPDKISKLIDAFYPFGNKGVKDVFKVRQPTYYNISTEELSKPKILGSYSVDGDRDFKHDRSMLKFLDRRYLPEEGKRLHVNLDLNKGMDKFNPYNGNPEESFRNLLRWILDNQDCLMQRSSQRLKVDFVGLRGVFNKIMRSPYNAEFPWTRLYVTEFKGTVYIVNWKREDELKPTNNKHSRNWGHTFEHYMCGAHPKNGINANEEYRCVLESSIGGHKLLYAPEVDCADPEQFDEDSENPEAFVLVKCCTELTSFQKKMNHRRRTLNRWWLENKLAGIPRIIVGYRNYQGSVHTLELLHTDDLPEMSGGEWDPNVCFNFLIEFLEYMRNCVSESPGTVFAFERKSSDRIYCTKLSGKSHINVLPSWYTNELFVKEE